MDNVINRLKTYNCPFCNFDVKKNSIKKTHTTKKGHSAFEMLWECVKCGHCRIKEYEPNKKPMPHRHKGARWCLNQ